MLLADIFPGSFEQRASWQPYVGRALVLLLWLEGQELVSELLDVRVIKT